MIQEILWYRIHILYTCNDKVLWNVVRHIYLINIFANDSRQPEANDDIYVRNIKKYYNKEPWPNIKIDFGVQWEKFIKYIMDILHRILECKSYGSYVYFLWAIVCFPLGKIGCNCLLSNLVIILFTNRRMFEFRCQILKTTLATLGERNKTGKKQWKETNRILFSFLFYFLCTEN